MVEIPDVIKQSLDSYIKSLIQYYRLERVIVFDSVAHGTSQKNSDIDLAIFSSGIDEKNEIDVMADLMVRAMPYKLDIQPLVYPVSSYYSDDDFIQKEIIERGIEIYNFRHSNP